MTPNDRHFSTTPGKAVVDTTTQYAIAKYAPDGNFLYFINGGVAKWSAKVGLAIAYSSPHRAQVAIEDLGFDAFVVNVVTTVTKHRFGGGAVPRKATRG